MSPKKQVKSWEDVDKPKKDDKVSDLEPEMKLKSTWQKSKEKMEELEKMLFDMKVENEEQKQKLDEIEDKHTQQLQSQREDYDKKLAESIEALKQTRDYCRGKVDNAIKIMRNNDLQARKLAKMNIDLLTTDQLSSIETLNQVIATCIQITKDSEKFLRLRADDVMNIDSAEILDDAQKLLLNNRTLNVTIAELLKTYILKQKAFMQKIEVLSDSGEHEGDEKIGKIRRREDM